MRRAFVSHSTVDDSYVAEMESFLHAAGYDEVFNDVRAIRPDEQFWPAIEKGIVDCDALVVIVSFASMTSEWVKREVEYARALSKNIIPLRIDDCSIPPIFDGRHVIDFRPPTRQERRFEISRIDKYAPAELIGREDETKLLNDAWQKVLRIEKGRPHILTFVALGGEGKTSLVAKWAAELAHQDWPGCDAAFAWSFYSQGTREQVAASSDLFLKEALTFFGDDADKAFAASPAGAYEKGQRLARIIGQRRSLLILDGLEPLQYAPTSPTPGQLKDQGIAALLRGLAATSHGLCLVTTRYSLPDLKAFWQTTAPEVKLLRLSRAAGVHLLQSLGVKGSLLRNLPLHDDREQVNEFEKLVEDVQGHALTLNLLGTYLRDAHAGDIRKRDLVKLEEADAEEQGGHAFRVIEAYECEFEREGDKGQRALAVLRLLGLFDRPLTSDCLGALLQAPAIVGLTEPLVNLTEAQRNMAFKRLEDARLLTVNRNASGALYTLDAHPLLREYFARHLCMQQPDAWGAAHRRLYEHLCESTKEGDQPTLEDLQPLYQAVAHGCQAGLQQEAAANVYRDRILRDEDGYSLLRLGAVGSDLGAVAFFFEVPWIRVSQSLSVAAQIWLLSRVAYLLRANGRLAEALEALRAVLAHDVRKQMWEAAASDAGSLSQLLLILGDVAVSVQNAQLAVTYAERGYEEIEEINALGTQADALHQAGRRVEAKMHLLEAERIFAECDPKHPLLNSGDGFRYCDLLLAAPERSAWQSMVMNMSQSRGPVAANPLLQLVRSLLIRFFRYGAATRSPMAECALVDVCRAIVERATQTLKWTRTLNNPSDIAHDHLTLGRAALYAKILEGRVPLPFGQKTQKPDINGFTDVCVELDAAMTGLHRVGDSTRLPLALLTRAWLRFLTGARTGPESAQADLDEAWEIAERGPMRLHMADIHLHRARLFFREAQYPWESPQADLAAAEKLINDCGYHRRDEELADAKRAILGSR